MSMQHAETRSCRGWDARQTAHAYALKRAVHACPLLVSLLAQALELRENRPPWKQEKASGSATVHKLAGEGGRVNENETYC